MDKTEFLALTGPEQVEAVLQAMADIVTEFGPNYIYQKPGGSRTSCWYVIEDAPSCLIAQVLSRLGWDLGELGGHEGVGVAYWFRG